MSSTVTLNDLDQSHYAEYPSFLDNNDTWWRAKFIYSWVHQRVKSVIYLNITISYKSPKL